MPAAAAMRCVPKWPQGAPACVKPLTDRKRRPAFSVWAYRPRNRIKLFFNRLRPWHVIATRFETDPGNDLARAKLAAARFWMLLM